MEEQLPVLQELASLALKNTFNADNLGLNYSMASGTTVAKEWLPGRKKAKERIYVLASSNGNGFEKVPLVFIGSAVKPRAFTKRSGQGLGIDYHTNGKAWRTQSLCYEWLRRFDATISRKPDRKVAFLVNKCVDHGSGEAIP